MLFAVLIGCSSAQLDNESSFNGIVLENNESYLLVEPVAGSTELNSADKIMVFLGEETMLQSQDKPITIDDIEAGRIIEIVYDGGIAESYPAQINSCQKIRKLDYDVFTRKDENFLVKTYIDKLVFKENEEISMYSTIEYIGEKDSISIWSGEPYFHYTIYNGQEYFNEGLTKDILKQRTLNKNQIYTIPFSKSGGYSADDPKADFWKDYYAEKELKLPKGEYFFTAYTDFSLYEEQVEKVALTIDFEVKVN